MNNQASVILFKKKCQLFIVTRKDKRLVNISHLEEGGGGRVGGFCSNHNKIYPILDKVSVVF